MGKGWSYLKRPLKNFNVENRAIRAADRHKVSPRHPTEVKVVEQLRSEHPEIFQPGFVTNKDDRLDSFLRQVRVESGGENPGEKRSVRPLPQKNWRADGEMDWTYGFIDVPAEKIPPGKLSFRQSVEIFHFFQADPSRDNFTQILKSSQLTEEQLKKTLKYFALYKVSAEPKVLVGAKLDLLKGFEFTRVLNPPINEVINYLADKQEAADQQHKLDVEREKLEGRKNFAKTDEKP